MTLAAGLVSFFTPCVIPLLPGYLSYVTGLSVSSLPGANRVRVITGAVLFVVGFSVVFVSYGTAFGALGFRLQQQQGALSVVVGLVLIVLGLAYLGWIPLLNRSATVRRVPAVGLAAAPAIGGLFALGWTPCLGPTLSAVLGLSFTEATAQRGALLTFVYCLGLGLPFVAAAFGFRWCLGLTFWARRHQRVVSASGGLMLVTVGVLLVTGLWGDLVVELRSWFPVVTTAI